jgi:hypothetical protein
MKNTENTKYIFFKKAAVLGFSFALLLFVLNILYFIWVVPETVLGRSDKQFEDRDRDSDIIFFGDSHVLSGINPKYIDKSFNFASTGENYFQTYYKLKGILESDIEKPKAIALSIDLHSFSSTRVKDFGNLWYWRKYIPFREMVQFSEENKAKQWVEAYVPIIGNGAGFLELFLQSNNSSVTLGYKALNEDFEQEENRKKAGEKRAKFHFKDAEDFDKLLVEKFSEIINLAQENNVEVFLIKFPVSKEYLEGADKYIEVKKYYENVDEILGKTKNKGKDIRLLDYQDEFFDNPNYFSDSDHLNHRGAKKLSEIIADEL